MQNLSFSRELLNQRHRLSHQQIDVLRKEKYSKEHLVEKHGQMFQVAEFIKLSDEFRNANLPFTPLKGPIISYRLHNDATYRYSRDLDFLFPLDVVEEATFILQKKGYEPYFFPWPKNLKEERQLVKYNDQIIFFHPKKQLIIEIHWKLFKLKITNKKVLSEVLRSNRHQISFNQRSFDVFNNELELLYLIIHGGLHAWFRLKWLVDVKDFIEKIPIKDEKFTQLVIQLNASRMVSLCNAILAVYFPESSLLPCKTIKFTQRRLKFTLSEIKKEEEDYKSNFKKIRGFLFRMSCFPGVRFKISVLAEYFYAKYYKLYESPQNS